METGVEIRASEVRASGNSILLSIRIPSLGSVGCFGLLRLIVLSGTFFWMYKPYTIFAK